MIYPKKLQKGDTIGLVCTSSPISQERVTRCENVIKEMGYKVKLADNLATNYGGYMAGKGDVRGRWLNEMFADKEVDGIFCVRGGDGGSRAMDYVDLEIIKSNPKIFVGYSDITSIHLAINQQCGLVTFHGPMVSSNMVDNFDDESKESFFHAINAEEPYKFQNTKGHEISIVKPGRATGPLVGGNLSLLSASIGTPYEVDTRGKILFIEEVDETVNRLERYSYHLHNSGKFRDCLGVILGQFSDCENKNEPGYTAVECLKDVLEDFDIPVLANIQSGHDFPMMTLPMGAECTMDAEDGSIWFGLPKRL